LPSSRIEKRAQGEDQRAKPIEVASALSAQTRRDGDPASHRPALGVIEDEPVKAHLMKLYRAKLERTLLGLFGRARQSFSEIKMRGRCAIHNVPSVLEGSS
jgi:hypothetical protein